MNQLLRYDAAVAAVAAAATTDEVADWENKAAAMHEYGRRIRDRSVEINMATIKARCKRRRGEILREYREAGRLHEGKPAAEIVLTPGQLPPVTLEDLDISRNESSECQRIAELEGSSFERLIERCRSYMEENPNTHVIDVLHVKDGPINGARALMGSRHEPDDSLDYFPTPPWATRALVERALSHLGIKKIQYVWEPACGEGHIAEVLSEYSEHVRSTDIHDYGYGISPVDFLTQDKNTSAGTDWIITNPPFDEKAEAFVLQALALAKIGVAMFFRLQWIPTVGRYNRIFGPRPPTLVAFFSERVPLVKGRWDPTASTATDYVWLVWLKGKKPQAPFWIPPGQRELLTRPDDIERFTAHPCKARAAIVVPHDPITGEIRAAI